jgi:hypothetical protein
LIKTDDTLDLGCFVPALTDRIIYERVSTPRSAFTSEVEQRQKVRQEAA